jgi:hypothetical protein
VVQSSRSGQAAHQLALTAQVFLKEQKHPLEKHRRVDGDVTVVAVGAGATASRANVKSTNASTRRQRAAAARLRIGRSTLIRYLKRSGGPGSDTGR